MSVLVTGGAGYIGGHMVLGLLDAGEKVVVLDNLSTGFAWAVPDGVELVVGDFGDTDAGRAADPRSTRSTRSPISRPRSSCRNWSVDPLGYYLNNTAKARNLIEMRGQGRGQALHLLLDRRGLWRDEPPSRSARRRRSRRSRPMAARS